MMRNKFTFTFKVNICSSFLIKVAKKVTVKLSKLNKKIKKLL